MFTYGDLHRLYFFSKSDGRSMKVSRKDDQDNYFLKSRQELVLLLFFSLLRLLLEFAKFKFLFMHSL